MLRTCFSSRKGYHLQEEYEEYEQNYTVTNLTVGFEQLEWSNQFNYLLPLTEDDDNDDGNDVDDNDNDNDDDNDDNTPLRCESVELSQVENTPSKKQKLGKLERKELRKLKRLQRKLPKHLKLRSDPNNNSNFSFKELTLMIETVPESFELHNTSLYRQDLYTLEDQEWLNDNIITYVYNILETYQLKPFYQKYNLSENTILLLPPSLCYLVLVSRDPKSLLSMFPEQFQKCKFLILPLNDGGTHWSLSVISILDNTLYSFDSLTNLNMEENKLLCFNFSIIISHLIKKEKFKLVSKTLKTPQQLNLYDCGIFVLCLTCFVVSELIGAKVKGSSWRLNFNLDFKIKNVDCITMRKTLLRSIIDCAAVNK